MSSFAAFVGPHPRAFPEPMHEWHQKLYEAAEILTRRLQNLHYRPILSDYFLYHLGLGVIRDRLDVDNEPIDNEPIDNGPIGNEPNGNEPSMIPRFFRPAEIQVAAQRVQRWNEVNRWPAPDLNRPEIIEHWRGCQIRTNIPLFDDIEVNFRRCYSLLANRGHEEEQEHERDSRNDDLELLRWAKFE